MDPLTIGVLSGSVIAGLGGASIAGLRAWNGWLELKKMELTQTVGDRALAPPGGPREIGGQTESGRNRPADAAGIDI